MHRFLLAVAAAAAAAVPAAHADPVYWSLSVGTPAFVPAWGPVYAAPPPAVTPLPGAGAVYYQGYAQPPGWGYPGPWAARPYERRWHRWHDRDDWRDRDDRHDDDGWRGGDR